jgi:hypothetical protein
MDKEQSNQRPLPSEMAWLSDSSDSGERKKERNAERSSLHMQAASWGGGEFRVQRTFSRRPSSRQPLNPNNGRRSTVHGPRYDAMRCGHTVRGRNLFASLLGFVLRGGAGLVPLEEVVHSRSGLVSGRTGGSRCGGRQ